MEVNAVKTMIDLDEDLLAEVVRLSKAKTKKEAVHTAMREYVKAQGLRELRDMLGTVDLDMTLEDLERLREEE